MMLVRLYRDSFSTPWGFRLQGGKDLNQELVVQRVFSNSPAERELQRGDVILSINGRDSSSFTHKQALDCIKHGGGQIELCVRRPPPGTTVKPLQPTSPTRAPPLFSPVKAPSVIIPVRRASDHGPTNMPAPHVVTGHQPKKITMNKFGGGTTNFGTNFGARSMQPGWVPQPSPYSQQYSPQPSMNDRVDSGPPIQHTPPAQYQYQQSPPTHQMAYQTYAMNQPQQARQQPTTYFTPPPPQPQPVQQQMSPQPMSPQMAPQQYASPGLSQPDYVRADDPMEEEDYEYVPVSQRKKAFGGQQRKEPAAVSEEEDYYYPKCPVWERRRLFMKDQPKVVRSGKKKVYKTSDYTPFGTDYSKPLPPQPFNEPQRPRPPPPPVERPVNAAPPPPPVYDEPDTSSSSKAWSSTLRSSGGPRPWEQEKQEYIMPSQRQEAPQAQRRQPPPAVSPKPSRSHPQTQPTQPKQSPQRQITVRSVPYEPSENAAQDRARVVHLQYNSPMGLYSSDNVLQSYAGQIDGQHKTSSTVSKPAKQPGNQVTQSKDLNSLNNNTFQEDKMKATDKTPQNATLSDNISKNEMNTNEMVQSASIQKQEPEKDKSVKMTTVTKDVDKTPDGVENKVEKSTKREDTGKDKTVEGGQDKGDGKQIDVQKNEVKNDKTDENKVENFDQTENKEVKEKTETEAKIDTKQTTDKQTEINEEKDATGVKEGGGIEEKEEKNKEDKDKSDIVTQNKQEVTQESKTENNDQKAGIKDEGMNKEIVNEDKGLDKEVVVGEKVQGADEGETFSSTAEKKEVEAVIIKGDGKEGEGKISDSAVKEDGGKVDTKDVENTGLSESIAQKAKNEGGETVQTIEGKENVTDSTQEVKSEFMRKDGEEGKGDKSVKTQETKVVEEVAKDEGEGKDIAVKTAEKKLSDDRITGDTAKLADSKVIKDKDMAKVTDSKAKDEKETAKSSDSKAKDEKETAKSSDSKAKDEKETAKSSDSKAKDEKETAKSSDSKAKDEKETAKSSDSKVKDDKETAKSSDSKVKDDKDKVETTDREGKVGKDQTPDRALGTKKEKAMTNEKVRELKEKMFGGKKGKGGSTTESKIKSEKEGKCSNVSEGSSSQGSTDVKNVETIDTTKQAAKEGEKKGK